MTGYWLKAILLLLVTLPAALAQQQSEYVEMVARQIKALSSQQMQDLQHGRGMGLSLAAELNTTPGPLHVLELRAILQVSDLQARELGRIIASMKARAQSLGVEVIEAERALDSGFATGAIDEAGVEKLTQRIASLTGQLRAVHLKAHLQTKGLLSPAQISAYDEARGYALHGAEPIPNPTHPAKSHR